MSNIWEKVKKSEFTKNVTTQVLGTGIAQVLPFLATPLLTRLFTEKDFAIYTSFFAIASIFAVAVGGKYYLAIVLPKEEGEAHKVFLLSIYLTIAYTFALAGILPFFHQFFPENLHQVLYFVPVYVLFYGLWSSYVNVSIRHKTFSSNAISKVLQSAGYIVCAIGLGFSKIMAFGLVVAKVFGTASSWIFLTRKVSNRFRMIPLKNLRKVAIEYIDFPKYGIWPAFLNTISLQALILILAKFYPIDDLGFYGLTYMVLSAPLTLIGASYKDVFYQKMADLMNTDGQSKALLFFKKSTLALFAMGLPIGLTLYFFGEPLFSFVFGEKWERSGEFASILALSFVVKLVVSPLSSVFNATNKLRIASRWQVLYFVTTFLTLGSCAMIFELKTIHLLMVYVLHEIVLYGIYFGLQYRMIKSINLRT